MDMKLPLLFLVFIFPITGLAYTSCSSKGGQKYGYYCNSNFTYQDCANILGLIVISGGTKRCTAGYMCVDDSKTRCIPTPVVTTPITTTTTITTTKATTTTTGATTATSVTTAATSTGPTAANCTKCDQRFPNPNDCFSYYVCSYANSSSSNNIFSITEIVCSYPTAFDSINLVCSPNAYCPYMQNICKGDTTYGNPTDPSIYYFCVPIQPQPVLCKQPLTCSEGYYFNNVTSSCTPLCQPADPNDCSYYFKANNPVPSYDGSATNCTSVKDLDYEPFYADTECTKEGLFADALDCGRYYTCILDQNTGKFTKDLNSCPSLFHPIQRLCTTEPFKCLCTAKSDTFVCPGTEMLYVDPLCSPRYYICTMTYPPVYAAKALKCPSGLLWDPTRHVCTEQVIDNPGCGSDGCHFSDSNQNPDDYLWDLNDYCEGIQGKYPITADCFGYYECVNNTIVKKKCPEGYAYCPVIKQCKENQYVVCSFTMQINNITYIEDDGELFAQY